MQFSLHLIEGLRNPVLSAFHRGVRPSAAPRVDKE
jgi:hypothetical protein